MKKAYYYLFYKLYKFSEAAPSKWMSDMKAGIAIIALEICLFISLINYYNVFAVVGLSAAMTNNKQFFET